MWSTTSSITRTHIISLDLGLNIELKCDSELRHRPFEGLGSLQDLFHDLEVLKVLPEASGIACVEVKNGGKSLEKPVVGAHF